MSTVGYLCCDLFGFHSHINVGSEYQRNHDILKSNTDRDAALWERALASMYKAWFPCYLLHARKMKEAVSVRVSWGERVREGERGRGERTPRKRNSWMDLHDRSWVV